MDSRFDQPGLRISRKISSGSMWSTVLRATSNISTCANLVALVTQRKSIASRCKCDRPILVKGGGLCSATKMLASFFNAAQALHLGLADGGRKRQPWHIPVGGIG